MGRSLNDSSAKTTSWMAGTESALSQIAKAMSTQPLEMGSDLIERRSLFLVIVEVDDLIAG